MTRQGQSSSCQPEQLLLYHYAELEVASSLQVEQHLQYCSACRSELTALQTALKAVPSTALELSPAEVHRFSVRVMECLPRRRFARPALGWALAGAAAVLITVNLRHQIPTVAPVPTRAPVMMTAEQNVLPDLELLQNLELLENLDLIQQLETLG